ncbi:serine-rich adhesin for platelets [Penaeus vannamei]|uniref:serine-rich adhesin for platelets n=1 Tax=Penaeus vannamei TaxID=6689 RepID=UPI00387F70CA
MVSGDTGSRKQENGARTSISRVTSSFCVILAKLVGDIDRIESTHVTKEMDDTTDPDLCLREHLNGKNGPTSEGLVRDTGSSRNSIPKVSLKLPFKSEAFRAQSLLARFHSSRKSESGIKHEVKSGSAAPWRSGGRHKQGGSEPPAALGDSPSAVENSGSGRSTTSASLPEDLNQNLDAGEGEGAQEGKGAFPVFPKARGKGTGGDDERPDSTSLSTEAGPFVGVGEGGQKGVESWFRTWPGRPRKLKGLRKKLLTAGTSGKAAGDLANGTREEQGSGPREEGEGLLVQGEGEGHVEGLSESSCVSVPEDEGEMTSRVVKGSPHVSLDALLESLPLVYDPATKQLCLGTPRKGQNNYMNKRMSNTTATEGSECDGIPEKLKLDFESDCSTLEEREEESLKESLLKTSDICDTASPPKPLEIIQEVDESGENIRLIDKNPSPQSGNVSGSSSLERGYYESPRNSLQRVSTNNSLSITDASSFSSLSSSNTELSAYSATDSAVCLGSQQSDTSSLRDFSIADSDGKTKKRGITDFLTRYVLWGHLAVRKKERKRGGRRRSRRKER